MNAEKEMHRGDGLGADPEPRGTVYALAVVVEADSREEAFSRIADEVSPEPANAHFVGEPFEINRADEYDTRGVADQLAAAARSPRCLFCNDPDGGATHCPHCGAYNRTEPLRQRTRAELRVELEQAGREYDEDEISAETYGQRKLEILEEALDAPGN